MTAEAAAFDRLVRGEITSREYVDRLQSRAGKHGRWTEARATLDALIAERDRYRHERDRLRGALEEIQDWAGSALKWAIEDDYEPGDEDTSDALVSARALVGMCRLSLAENQEEAQ